jgi:hypothetical protein
MESKTKYLERGYKIKNKKKTSSVKQRRKYSLKAKKIETN